MKKHSERYFAAIDLGSSNGRIVLGIFDGATLTLKEVHRFLHEPLLRCGLYEWDWKLIVENVIKGLLSASLMTDGGRIESVSCDSWAQDFGLLDNDGQLLGSPLSYRNEVFNSALSELDEVRSPQELVRSNGGVHSPITTLCQLKYQSIYHSEKLNRAAKMLNIADLIHYILGGVTLSDPTLLGASQLLSLKNGKRDDALLEKLNIPIRLVAGVKSGIVGKITHMALRKNYPDTVIISGVGHDTAAAYLAAAPNADELFLSLGSWAMVGCEIDAVPENITPDWAVLPLNDGKLGIFHAGNGMWLIQQCAGIWRENGENIDYTELDKMACQSNCDGKFNPDLEIFSQPSTAMEANIRSALPGVFIDGHGDLLHVINRSLIAKIGEHQKQIEKLTGKNFKAAIMVSGGVRSMDICRNFTKITNLSLRRGSSESSAVGNIINQMRYQGIATSNIKFEGSEK